MTATAAGMRVASFIRWRAAEAHVPLALAGLALLVGLVAAAQVGFAHNEGSAYYVAAAGNLAAGRGLVVDVLWSYATPPLVLPRPAFELWQPMASLLAAVPMALLGASFWAAQLAGVALGVTLAPLAWALTREAALALDTPPARAAWLAAGGGLLVSVLAPLVLARAVPDSTLAFAVFGTLACWLIPRALSGSDRTGLALGGVLGLAYLSRHEAVWIGLAFLILALAGGRAGLRRLAPVAVGGLTVVGPWLLRNVVAFGTPLPGQALDNALLTSNEQIFAYLDQPTVERFLAQGPVQIGLNIALGAAYNLVDVLLVPAFPVGLIGVAGALLAWRRPAMRRTALGALLLAGLLTYAVSSVVFPVATRWGTFQHASGPVLVGLAVASVLAVDRFVVLVGRARRWQRDNAWLAPAGLLSVAAVLTVLQLVVVGAQAEAARQRVAALAAAVAEQPEVRAGKRPLLVSDRPIWLATATGLPAVVLPREPAEVVLRLVDELAGGPAYVVLSDATLDPRRGAGADVAACFAQRPAPAGLPGALVLLVRPGCSP